MYHHANFFSLSHPCIGKSPVITIAYSSNHAPPLRSRLLLGTHLHVSSSLTDHGDDNSLSEMARYSRWILDIEGQV